MPEIKLTIDADTGNMETEIEGIKGPACEKIADKIKELTGEPTRDEKTSEYHTQTVVKQQTKR